MKRLAIHTAFSFVSPGVIPTGPLGTDPRTTRYWHVDHKNRRQIEVDLHGQPIGRWKAIASARRPGVAPGA